MRGWFVSKTELAEVFFIITIKKMSKIDVPILYELALRAFQPDFEKYGVYPPLLNVKKKSFLPPRLFGKTIYEDDTIIGGAFIVALGKKGEIGAIFLDPSYQKKGYGRQTMLAIENRYPRVTRWKLETPSESIGLHRFYEALGYIKTDEMKDPKSDMIGFIYEKNM